MANSFLALPVTAANGPGTAVDVSTLGASKTLVVEGNGSGLYEPYVLIEVSNDNAHLIWTPLFQFNRPGSITLDCACRYMRASIKNYRQGGAPTVNVGSTDAGTSFIELIAPAGNGNGAAVVSSTLGGYKTVQVSGTFKGACNIEISNDGGTSWTQINGLSFQSGGGICSLTFLAEQMRVSRSGIQAREPNPGLPIVDIGACDVGGVVPTDLTLAKLTVEDIVIDPALELTPAAGTINNYAPAGWDAATWWRLDTTAGACSLSGISATGIDDGSIRYLTNLGPQSLSLLDQDAGSLAANRIAALPAPGVVLAVNSTAQLMYDATLARWIVLGMPWGGTIIADTGAFQNLVIANNCTPPALPAGVTNNLAPAAFANNSSNRWATDAAGSTVTGIVAPGTERFILLTNLGPGELIFTDEDALSTAANRFALGGASVVLPPDAAVVMRYDAASARWRVYGTQDALTTLSPVLTPAALAAGTTNDYGPAGLAGASVLRLDTTAGNATLTGLVAQRGGDIRVIENIGANLLVLASNDAGSAAANRFSLGANSYFVIPARGTATVIYDATISEWVLISSGQGAAMYADTLTVGGAYANSGIATVDVMSMGSWRFNSQNSPAALAAGNTNDYAISDSEGTIRITTDAANSVLTGIAGSGGRAVHPIFNLGPGTLTLKNADAGSAAANRFELEGAADRVIGVGGFVLIQYDVTSTKWRCCG